MLARLAVLVLTVAAAVPLARANDYPQPVRAGDLAGRKLIGPTAAQKLLGHVEAVERAPGGELALRVHTGGLLPWGGRSVDVPVGAVALLGEHVALVGLTEAQLDALPSVGTTTPLAPDDTLRIGLVRPFH